MLICTPEYAYGMPGRAKNALDWLVSSGDLYRKPFAALSASPSHQGGRCALAWLAQTLEAQHAAVPGGASFAVPFVRRVLDGDRVADAELAARLRSVLTALGWGVSAPSSARGAVYGRRRRRPNEPRVVSQTLVCERIY